MNIKYLNDKDREALLALARCGHVTEEELLTIITAKRISNYIRAGIIAKEVYHHTTNRLKCYKLTCKGQKIIKKKWGFINFQHAQNPYHDSIVSQKYFSLTEKEKKSWKTETEVKGMLVEVKMKVENNEEYSALDAIYVNKTGRGIGFEAVTSNYTKRIIKAKINTCKLLKIEYEERRRR